MSYIAPLPRADSHLPPELIGIAIGKQSSSAVRVCFVGQGVEARAEILATHHQPTPEVLQYPGPPDWTEANLAGIAAEMAEHAGKLARAVASHEELARVDVIGLGEPGLWRTAGPGPMGYLALCDAARLAETTGVSVVDAFPARDVAQGGLGGPLSALPYWIWLHDTKKPRVLLELNDTIQITYLPAGCEASCAGRVMATQCGPGIGLLKRLVARRTANQPPEDGGSQHAVQGQVVAEFVDHMLATPYFDEPSPRWHPGGAPLDWFHDEALQLAADNQWSLDDVLRSTTRLIAAAIAREILEHIPKTPPLQQLVVAGPGHQNGLLLREISSALPDVDVVQLSELQIEGLAGQSELLPAVSAATLAWLHASQVPAANLHTTAASAYRVLGRLTPGNPNSWQRLLRRMAANQPEKLPLRSAI